MSNLDGHTVVADVPAFLYAVTEEVLGGFILWVSTSPIVRESYGPLRKVMELIEDRCTTLVGRSTVPDPAMMWAESVRTTYAVHEMCPGLSVQHHCAVRLTDKKAS